MRMSNAEMLAAVTNHLDRIREIGRDQIGLPDDMTARWAWESAQCPLGFVKMELEQLAEQDRMDDAAAFRAAMASLKE